jgi:hypothetical protein
LHPHDVLPQIPGAYQKIGTDFAPKNVAKFGQNAFPEAEISKEPAQIAQNLIRQGNLLPLNRTIRYHFH